VTFSCIVSRTRRLDEMRRWYQDVFGARVQ
jgi:catechol 2,3-dioxygenase-like lactoylglutathione lyase family enzyme